MDAEKPIYLQTAQLENMWRELWWKMAGGVKSEYDRMKATNLFEFYHLFDLWRDQVKREKNLFQQKKHANGKGS